LQLAFPAQALNAADPAASPCSLRCAKDIEWPHTLQLGTEFLVKVIVCIFWSLVAVASAFAEEPREDAIIRLEKEAYAKVENTIKQEFDGAVATIKKSAPNQEAEDTAIGVTKTIFYNKANISAECMGDGETRFKSCFDAKLDELMINFRLLTDYADFFAGKDLVRCEVEARLFKREQLLPLYDFLKGDRIFLYDLGAADATTLKRLGKAACELDAFKPNLTSAEVDLRIAIFPVGFVDVRAPALMQPLL
jgi:hypothetical protein